MTGYDPFTRGPHPVGVRTVTVDDPGRAARSLPVEVWYPATADHAGQDTAEATRDAYELIPGFPAVWQEAVRDATPDAGRHPLVVFSHGWGGHRRQSTFLCTHLASHGYVVAAPDHVGNTIQDAMLLMLAVLRGGPRPDPVAVGRAAVGFRPGDVSLVIDRLLAGDLGALLDAERIGVAGHSFGGWTTLTATARDRRIRAALPLAPAGGASPLPVTPLVEGLDLRWQREVPTLFVVADRDTILPLDGMRDLYARTPVMQKQLVVLRDTDHMHFCDRVEQVHEMFRMMPQDPGFQGLQASIPPISELAPGEHAYLAVRGLGLAHMDAALRGMEAAAELVGGDVAAALAARGVAVSVG